MIKAVIFDLDNTLLDFVTMKREAVKNALSSMIEVGLDIDSKTSYKRIMQLYEENGWERNQYVFNKFLREVDGRLNHKYLAAGIVAYRRAKDKHLKLYPNVEKTLNEIKNKGIKLAIVSDGPNREVPSDHEEGRLGRGERRFAPCQLRGGAARVGCDAGPGVAVHGGPAVDGVRQARRLRGQAVAPSSLQAHWDNFLISGPLARVV